MGKRGPHGRGGLEWRIDRCRSGCSMRGGEASLPAVCVETRHVTSMQQENSKLAFRKIFSVPIMTPLQSEASSPAMIQRPGGLMVCRLRLAGG